MPVQKWTRRILATLVATVLVAACGSGGSANGTATTAASAPPTTNAAPAQPLTVFAAASLTEAFKKARPSDRFNFAGSQTLVTQLTQGAPADVFASADEVNMKKATDAGVVETPQIFVTNKLVIVTAPGNPKGVKGLSDLARPDLRVVLADKSVPVGNFSQQALTKANVKVEPKSHPLDVKATLATVTSGAADAAIVYLTDARSAGEKAATVTIPDDQNVIAKYPIAVVKSTKNPKGAEEFVASARNGELHKALMNAGFSEP